MTWRSRSRSKPDAPPPPGADEYSAVSLGSIWGIASLILFVAALTARQLLALLPLQMRGYHMMPPLAVSLTPALGLAGVMLGLVGMRRQNRRTVALLGLGLNAIVVLLSSIFLIGFWWVRLR